MEKVAKITKERAAERFLQAMLSDDIDFLQKSYALDEYIETKSLRASEKKAALAPLVPELASYAERVTSEKHPKAYGIRYVVVNAIRLAPREAAVEGLIKIKKIEPDADRRYYIQTAITKIRRSLNATKHRMSRKAEAGQRIAMA